jgi:hypothetical protein
MCGSRSGLSGNAEILDEAGQRLADVLQRGFLGFALAVRSHARTQSRVGVPNAILVTVHDYRHSYRARFGHLVMTARFSDRLSARSITARPARDLVKCPGNGLPVTRAGWFAWCIVRPTMSASGATPGPRGAVGAPRPATHPPRGCSVSARACRVHLPSVRSMPSSSRPLGR